MAHRQTYYKGASSLTNSSVEVAGIDRLWNALYVFTILLLLFHALRMVNGLIMMAEGRHMEAKGSQDTVHFKQLQHFATAILRGILLIPQLPSGLKVTSIRKITMHTYSFTPRKLSTDAYHLGSLHVADKLFELGYWPVGQFSSSFHPH